MNTQTRGILCALSGGILWGYSGTIGQYLFANYEISSEWLTTARMICAGVILLAFGLLKHMPIKAVWTDRTAAFVPTCFALGLRSSG